VRAKCKKQKHFTTKGRAQKLFRETNKGKINTLEYTALHKNNKKLSQNENLV